MKSLATFAFSAFSDRAFSSVGWFLLAGVVVDALAGNDVIVGEGADTGILNAGDLYSGDGSDSILGNGYFSGLVNRGTIETGGGSDHIEGSSTDFEGIINSGLIHTGAGADALYGRADDAGAGSIANSGIINTGVGDDVVDGNGIDNSGTIFTGPGDDEVTGWPFEGFYGIVNSRRIAMYTGNDRIIGSGLYSGILNLDGSVISLGDGNDAILAGSQWESSDSVSITNQGFMGTGSGHDLIRTSIHGDSGQGMIDNSGSLVTGDGADTVDALWGGFAGDGLTDLGSGNDTILGFGAGHFRGGTGVDTLVFTPGRYAIRRLGAGEFMIGGLMNVSGFEAFGDGATQPSFAAAASNGFVTFT